VKPVGRDPPYDPSMTSGYSGKPLAAKLGLKPGHSVALDNAPAGFVIEGLPAETELVMRPGRSTYDLILAFCQDRSRLARRLPARQLALPLGVVDIKVCAIDDIWSGLKLVRRRANR
jgi:hypothetical protein